MPIIGYYFVKTTELPIVGCSQTAEYVSKLAIVYTVYSTTYAMRYSHRNIREAVPAYRRASP